MLFLFKKIVAPLFYPLSLCLALLLVGILLLWFTRKQKAGKIVVSIATGLILLFSYSFGTNMLLRSLEHEYAPVALENLQVREIQWVVVLGGGGSSDPDIPPLNRLSESSLAHLIEGIRLHRQLPGSRLILSGSRVFGTGSDADSMRELALQLGVAPESLIAAAPSPDTET